MNQVVRPSIQALVIHLSHQLRSHLPVLRKPILLDCLKDFPVEFSHLLERVTRIWQTGNSIPKSDPEEPSNCGLTHPDKLMPNSSCHPTTWLVSRIIVKRSFQWVRVMIRDLQIYAAIKNHLTLSRLKEAPLVEYQEPQIKHPVL